MRKVDPGYAYFGFCLIAFFAFASYCIITDEAGQAQRDVEAKCHARGMYAASETENHGKTSSSARFCVAKDGAVYWLGDSK